MELKKRSDDFRDGEYYMKHYGYSNKSKGNGLTMGEKSDEDDSAESD